MCVKQMAGRFRAIQRVLRGRIRLPGMMIRVACAVILGLMGLVVFSAVQWGLASRAYPGGVGAFGRAKATGPWPVEVESRSWQVASFRSRYGDWFGAVRKDAYWSPMMGSVLVKSSHMYIRWDENLQFSPGEWISDVDLRGNSWVAGCESFAVGWPLRSFLATFAWKGMPEYDRVPRAIVVEGSEIDGPEDRTWFENLLGGLRSPLLLKEIIPTHVLSMNAIVNWAVWSSMFFAASLLPSGVRWIRGIYRVRRGRCGRCGYDVRASTGCCPECGRLIGGRSDGGGQGVSAASGG